MKRLNFVLCLVCTLLISSAAHAATLRTVALSGQQVPGTPDGTVFTSFNGRSLVLNDAGQTAFLAGASDDFYYGSIWSEGGGSLRLVAANGQQAPGLPDGVIYGGFDYPLHLVINDAGSTAFAGHFASGSYHDWGFWSSGAGGSALIARSGEQAAGTPAGVVYIYSGTDNYSLVMNNAGQTAFWADLAGPGVDYGNDGVWAQRHGGLELVARTGNHAPGTPDGVNFGQFFLPRGPALNGLGQTAFGAMLTGPGVDLLNYTNAYGIWSEGSGSLALVARDGDQAPGMLDGAVFSGVNSPAFNNAGQTAFSGNVTGGGVDSTNDSGIWLETSGSLALVVRSGTLAPGTPSGVNFRTLTLTTAPVLNDTGQIAFKAGLTGPGVNSTNDLGFWSGAPGSPALVAREGDHAPGTEDGVVFRDFRFGSNVISPLILNAAGQTAFVATLTGSGISASNDFGIWATDRRGVLQLIAREGDPLEVALGDVRTVSILTFRANPYNLSTGNSEGQPSFFNNRGQLAFSASFTDGSSGIFVSNRVAVPEPSAFALAAAGLLGLVSCAPRRRDSKLKNRFRYFQILWFNKTHRSYAEH